MKMLTEHLDIMYLKNKKAGKTIAEELGILAEDNIIEIQKLWLADNKPVILATDVIPMNLFKKAMPPSIEPVPIFNILNEYCNENVYYNVTEVWAEKAGDVKPEICDMMQVETNMPMIIIKDIGFNKNNVPILYSHEVYRSGVMRFSLVRTRV